MYTFIVIVVHTYSKNHLSMGAFLDVDLSTCIHNILLLRTKIYRMVFSFVSSFATTEPFPDKTGCGHRPPKKQGGWAAPGR